MFEIQEALKTIFESEMIEGGRLEGVKKVYVGDYKLIPQCNYPAVFLVFKNLDFDGNSRRIELEIGLDLYLVSINACLEDSIREVQNLAWQDTETGPRGLLPLLLVNSGLMALEKRYKMKIARVNLLEAKEGDRYSAAIHMPIEVVAWRSLLDCS